ncbi:MAG: hypothetical protein WAU91_21990 [Desulfatitalea sp.]
MPFPFSNTSAPPEADLYMVERAAAEQAGEENSGSGIVYGVPYCFTPT